MDVEESPWADTKQPPSQDEPSATSQSTETSKPAATSQPASSSTSRPSRGPRRLVAQPTRLEAVDDPLGPLGGAPPVGGDGASPDDDGGIPPVPPQKEQMVIRTTMTGSQGGQQQARRQGGPHMDDYDDDETDGQKGPRAPPPVEAARPSGMRTSHQPSMSVEQAAKPSFQIYVGDPVKIGDLTSSHIVYSVRTKVCAHAMTT